MKKAIHQIAADVLADAKRAMTAEEIYDSIVSRGLYEFKAKDPKSVLRSQLRRHTESGGNANKSVHTIFTLSSDGKFSLK